MNGVSVQKHAEAVRERGIEHVTEDLAVPEWIFKAQLATNRDVQVIYLKEIWDQRIDIITRNIYHANSHIMFL